MGEHEKVLKYSTQVSESFDHSDEKCTYEVAFRRWLVREIEEKKLTIAEAIKSFNFNPQTGRILIQRWQKKYASETLLSLPDMTIQEKQNLKLLQEKNHQLEKQLEEAKMRNIALNMLIDVAEEKLKISIRKKPGTKQ